MLRLEAAIEEAVRILRTAGLVAFPTETVYGLGADASNPQAVRKIFAAKGRPADHPLIVHLARSAQLHEWARDIPPTAWRLAECFWPGPLTLILKRAPHVADVVTGGQDTVGLRVPSHPLAQAMLQAFGGGVAGPSANRFGRVSPTTAQHVRDELGDAVDLVLDGGACPVGIESTIIDLSGAAPVLLRPGHIKPEEIEVVLQAPVGRPTSASPRASGTLAAHYAPRLPLRIVPKDMLDAAIREAAVRGPVAVIARRPRPSDSAATLWMIAPRNAVEYARLLYAGLRQLDRSDCRMILVEALPDSPDWNAVRDRLTRAAAGSGGAGSSST
ncbi:MAG TPA: L-threonylcarbamoyladenylate synthase [Burkholderiales bacterium]|nr:L-threonylcarbamoyladenylate synthase [Burkholderiales bacterium]